MDREGGGGLTGAATSSGDVMEYESGLLGSWKECSESSFGASAMRLGGDSI